MQKLIAILFLLLMCSATLVSGLQAPAGAVEQLADSDKGKEAPPEKKETKEFLSHTAKRWIAVALTGRFNAKDIAYGLPKPALSKPTPPPDVIC